RGAAVGAQRHVGGVDDGAAVDLHRTVGTVIDVDLAAPVVAGDARALNDRAACTPGISVTAGAATNPAAVRFLRRHDWLSFALSDLVLTARLGRRLRGRDLALVCRGVTGGLLIPACLVRVRLSRRLVRRRR